MLQHFVFCNFCFCVFGWCWLSNRNFWNHCLSWWWWQMKNFYQSWMIHMIACVHRILYNICVILALYTISSLPVLLIAKSYTYCFSSINFRRALKSINCYNSILNRHHSQKSWFLGHVWFLCFYAVALKLTTSYFLAQCSSA